MWPILTSGKSDPQPSSKLSELTTAQQDQLKSLDPKWLK
jgi:hypothetical protein